MPRRLVLLIGSTILAVGCNTDSTTNPSPLPQGPTVTIVSGASALTTTAFNPNPIIIQHGQSVTWTNSDGTTHDVVANDGSFTTGNLAPSGSGTITFQTAGAYSYHCAIHPNMVAAVTVQ